jgi:hypothetical protein
MTGPFRYRVHSTAYDDLGSVEHPAPNLEPGDVIVLEDGREGLVTAVVPGPHGGEMRAMLEVAVVEAG